MGLFRRKTQALVRPRHSRIDRPRPRPERFPQESGSSLERKSAFRHGYVPLWCKTNFSFLEGAAHPEELVERARELGLPAVAITDRDGLYGIVRAHMKAKALGIQLLIGAQVALNDGSQIVLIAADARGYRNLCRLLSRGRLRSPKGCCRVSWDEVCRYAPGLIALWGGPQSLLVRETGPGPIAGHVKDAFADRLYALCCRHKCAQERRQERFLTQHAKTYGLPVVAAAEVLYPIPSQRPLHDVLTCLRARCTLSTAGRRIKPNAEYALKSPEAFFTTFSDKPRWVERTLDVARRCTFSLDQLNYRYPSETLPDGTTSWERLRTLTFEGAKGRYPKRIPPDVRRQLDRELELIKELDYSGYFLTMWEIVRFCRRRHILCQGRGSAANSAVCYCLGITAIDPVRMNLLFERFISKQRSQPPDIDLDIEHGRREEVIQYVYKKYGRRHAAMVAMVVRYRPRSAIRDVGKALGLPPADLERLARQVSYDRDLTAEHLVRVGLSPEIPAYAHLLKLSRELLGFPRHLSIHPGGFLLGREPVSDIVPLENSAMPERTVIQWDKDDIEALGLFKVDLLGLGALTHLHQCFDLLKRHRALALSMEAIPPEDPQTFDMLCRADTVGVFQLESRAQMAMLPRLRPRCFYDLVIEISLVRPGPITGGMVHPYLRRRNGQEPVIYPHPALEPVLKKTLGVPLFQEQVMKLAMVAADYSPGEADQLRRDMAAWRRRGCIERHRDRLVSRMIHKGIARQFAQKVFEQIRGFGEYGFPESHAASFALISYATAWMRRHYPAEFICGLLNAQPMGFYGPATIVEDARRMGVEVRPVDVTRSQWDCTLEPQAKTTSSRVSHRDEHPGFAVRMGLRFINGPAKADIEAMIAARKARPFKDLADFVQRTALDVGALKALARAGAFTPFGLSRRQALWQVAGLVHRRKDALAQTPPAGTPFFAPLNMPDLIDWDLAVSGHSAYGHCLKRLRARLRAMGLPTAKELAAFRDGRKVRYAGMVICRQRPATAGGVVFMTLEDETGFANLVLWKDIFRKYEVIAKTASFLGITGTVQHQQGVTHLVAQRLWIPRCSPAARAAIASRDFR